MAETKKVTVSNQVKGGTKVSKVENTKPEPKVTVNDVKPQIVWVKRHLHNYLVNKELAGKGSTHTKPVMKTGVGEKTVKTVKGEMTKLYNSMLKKYPHTTEPQKAYVKRQLVERHLPKYITHETK